MKGTSGKDLPTNGDVVAASRSLATEAELSRALLKRYVLPQRTKVIGLGLMLVSGTALRIVGPKLIQRFIDEVTMSLGRVALRTLVLIAIAFLLTTIGAQAVSVAATYLSSWIGWEATNCLRGDLAKHCLGLDMAFFSSHPPGEFIERIDGDVTALTMYFSEFIVQIFGSVLLLAGIVIVLSVENLLAGGALAAFSIVCLYILSASRNLATPALLAERAARAELAGFLEEHLRGLDDIRANGGGGYVMQRCRSILQRLTRVGRRAGMMGAGLFILSTMLFVLGYALALCVGVYLFRSGKFTIGAVYALVQYTAILRRPLEDLARQLRNFQSASAGILRIGEILSLAPTIRDGAGAERPQAGDGGAPILRFDEVDFSYGAFAPVLKNVTFNLAPGTTLGLLGRTGSGKSTITRLLLRLYDPTRGSIKLDGTDIRELKLGDLRSRVGLVTQDVQLLQATVRENVALFDERIPDDDVRRILNELGLGSWLSALPLGLDTMLGSGHRMSEGEAQLLAFARIFLRDPGIVILDEASSRLDLETEKLLDGGLDRLMNGTSASGRRRSAIIIAHRLTTVMRAQRIMILEDGCIQEQGEREGLIKDPDSRFSQLLRGGLEEVLA